MMRGAALALAVFLLVGGLLWLYLGKVFLIRHLRLEIAAIQARKEELRARLQKLEYMLSQREELQELAIRTRLRYGLPGEIVVVFGDRR